MPERPARQPQQQPRPQQQQQQQQRNSRGYYTTTTSAHCAASGRVPRAPAPDAQPARPASAFLTGVNARRPFAARTGGVQPHGHEPHRMQQQGPQRQQQRQQQARPATRQTGKPPTPQERAPAHRAAPAAGQASSSFPRPRSTSTRTTPAGRHQWLREDLRELPLPAPYDKHELRGGSAPRFDRPWSWPSWRTWAKACWDRTRWNKKDINRVLDLRSHDPANRGVDWGHVSSRWEACGVVYGVYHFAAGR
jgi:hypothetical protein